MAYHPEPAFSALFSAFTGGQADSIGMRLTEHMLGQGRDDPLVVSTASDIVCFPGGSGAPQVESFRKSTRGFIELTAVSHLPLALCYLARLRELQSPDEAWRGPLQALVEQARRTRRANTIAMWRDEVAVRAFAGAEANVVGLIDYALQSCIDYMQRALADRGLLDFERLRRQLLDAPPQLLPVNMNDIMFATFGLAYVDIAWRIGNWLRACPIDWSRAMVLVSGQSGRPTAGVTWSSNNICNLIWKASGERLPSDRLFVAPHAPAFSAEQRPDEAGLRALEHRYRQIWCNTRASVEVARRMFDGHEAYGFQPGERQPMPALRGIHEHDTRVARLRRIMEDPQQLLSNCVADYIVDELERCDHRPERVRIPGFTGIDYVALAAKAGATGV